MNLRLAGAALARWDEVEGYAVGHNLPPLASLPQGRFIAFMYWYLTRDGDAPAVGKFRARLFRPPPGEVPRPGQPWSADAERAAFTSLKTGLTTRPTSPDVGSVGVVARMGTGAP